LEGALRNYVQSGAPAAPTPQYAPPVPNTGYGVPAEEYVRGADLERLAPRMVQDTMRPELDALYASNAQQALEQVKREFPDAFAKYSPTIYGNLAGVDNRSRTVDNLRKVVKYSLADHLDEIVRDARRDSSPQEPALRSTGAAPILAPPSPSNDLSLKSERLPAEYREKLAKANITEATLDDYLRATGMTRGTFFKQFEERKIITEAPRK